MLCANYVSLWRNNVNKLKMKTSTYMTDMVCISNPSAKALAFVDKLRSVKLDKLDKLRENPKVASSTKG